MYVSADMEEGYPGELTATVTYEVTPGMWEMEYIFTLSEADDQQKWSGHKVELFEDACHMEQASKVQCR